ncbi:MAG TPA: hypothetical protein VLA19_22000 [Herpetosiphonaceae bacterium]|nr:hypothetical protein [Herpetosiphonaceae bacterium]
MGENRCAGPDAVAALDADPDSFVDRVVDLLDEGAADGAILIEVRFGRGTVLRPDFMRLFREAERRVRERYPRLRAEAIISGLMPSPAAADDRMEHVLQGCLDAAREGLAGVDIIPAPIQPKPIGRPSIVGLSALRRPAWELPPMPVSSRRPISLPPYAYPASHALGMRSTPPLIHSFWSNSPAVA